MAVTLKYVKENTDGFVGEVHRTVQEAIAAVLNCEVNDDYPVTIVDGVTVIREFRSALEAPEEDED